MVLPSGEERVDLIPKNREVTIRRLMKIMKAVKAIAFLFLFIMHHLFFCPNIIYGFVLEQYHLCLFKNTYGTFFYIFFSVQHRH